jgi:hypothetical protein
VVSKVTSTLFSYITTTMTTQTTTGPRPLQQASSTEIRHSDPLGCLPEVSRLSILSYLDPQTTLVGAEHLLEAHQNATDKKVAVAISGDKVLVSLGVRAGPYSRQHWQLIHEEGSRLHPEAKEWLDPTSRRPREEVWVCGTAFKVHEGKVTLGGGSLLFDPPSEIDSAHLRDFLQRVLDSKR